MFLILASLRSYCIPFLVSILCSRFVTRSYFLSKSERLFLKNLSTALDKKNLFSVHKSPTVKTFPCGQSCYQNRLVLFCYFGYVAMISPNNLQPIVVYPDSANPDIRHLGNKSRENICSLFAYPI